jgi:hypothetical protein
MNPLECQRPFYGGIVHQPQFVGFVKLQCPFQTAADVVWSRMAFEIVGDGIEAIDQLLEGGQGWHVGSWSWMLSWCAR